MDSPKLPEGGPCSNQTHYRRFAKSIFSRFRADHARGQLGEYHGRAKVNSAGIDVVASTPEQLAAAVKQDIVRLGKVIKDNNIREE